MEPRKKEEVENCPVFLASQILGKKWMILVIQVLMTPEASRGLRYSEISHQMEWIGAKVLTERLRELEEYDLVLREVDDTKTPAHVSYTLTKKGEGLRKAMEELQSWGMKYDESSTSACAGEGFSRCLGCTNHIPD
ncbi:MAG: transcriptional regulator [Candidatus Lokiarchaeota archaeon]|nr:transcriptional regulator [Candidatus Lokiarchaeota archaeon]